MTYRRRQVKAPKLAGWQLRAFVRVLELRVAEPLRRNLLNQSGFADLTDAPAEGATLRPALTAGREAHPTDEALPQERFLAEAAAHAQRTTGHRPVTISDYASAYRDGRADPQAVAEAVIANTLRSDEGARPLRLFINQDVDDVRRQAEQSAQRLRDGTARSILEGVPVSVKDEVDQVPYPTTVGRAGRPEPAVTDAQTVARLRAAGALLVGKANMHEIGIGVTGLNPHHGVCRNPLDPTRHTGGSSSGSGASVASGLVPLSLGADGGGSIRIPAALCGQVGLKPTFGRVSEHGAAPLCWNVAHLGPIASTATDAAVGYAVLAGPDQADENTHTQPPVHLDRVWNTDLSDRTYGVFRAWADDADDDVVAAFNDGLAALEARGAHITEVRLPDVDLARIAHLVVIATEMHTSQLERLKTSRSRFGLDVRMSLALAGSMKGSEYASGLRLRRTYVRALRTVLGDVDGLLTPGTATVAPLINEAWLPDGGYDLDTLDKIMRFQVLANLTGFPAITFPLATTAAGVPASMQVIGRPWEEAGLLRAAYAMEDAFERVAPHVNLTPLG